MNKDQETILRDLYKMIRKTRHEISLLYQEKDKLERISDQLYSLSLDSLWNKCNIQLTYIYENLLKKYNTLYKIQGTVVQIQVNAKDNLFSITSDNS